jgi:uncharacterized membrane protein YqjE
MAAQTSTNGQRLEDMAAGVGGNVANLASDLVSLAELQAKLAALDLRETGARSLIPAAVLTAGLCLLLGTVPVVLLGLAGALADTGSFSLVAAQLIVAVVAIGTSAACIWFGYQKIVASLNVLNRSREEFEANLRWIKKAIQQSSWKSSRS